MRFSSAPLAAARSRGVTAAAVAALALAITTSPAPAAITIGSDLAASDGTTACGASCTGVQTVIPGRMTASPISGVIVRWRVGDGVEDSSICGSRDRPPATRATTRTREPAAARR